MAQPLIYSTAAVSAVKLGKEGGCMLQCPLGSSGVQQDSMGT